MVPADPYRWPYDGPVEPRRLALVIAGAQLAWQRRSVGAEEVARVLFRVAGVVRAAGGIVVHLRHGMGAGGGGLPPSPSDADWPLATEPATGDLVVDVPGIDGFFASPLDGRLRRRRIDTLVLGGFGAEAAVSSTLRSANDRGYECLTLTDGSAPFVAETGRRSLSSITMSGGIFGAIAPSAALVAALAALHPHLSAAEASR